MNFPHPMDDHTGFADPHEQWVTCEACDGSGVIAKRITVYEHGCGFPHYDTHEEPCGGCGGSGWALA
jgi:DnaJ-class molecular chaperone